ncbi:MAG: hypothetical protein ACR2I1_07235 [Propionibacteriaceae bacterium]
MLLPKAVAEGVRDGTVTAVFRRWELPRVRAGSTQLTAAGIVRFDEVDEIPGPDSLTDADARSTGLADAASLRARLAPGAIRGGPRGSRCGDRVFRIRVSYAGADPRLSLREQVPDGSELAAVSAVVAKLDTGRRSGPWTTEILCWIRDHPGVVSTQLAARLGREVAPMKADIRKLKALGLTISLTVGYQLSPRGVAYLTSILTG